MIDSDRAVFLRELGFIKTAGNLNMYLLHIKVGNFWSSVVVYLDDDANSPAVCRRNITAGIQCKLDACSAELECMLEDDKKRRGMCGNPREGER